MTKARGISILTCDFEVEDARRHLNMSGAVKRHFGLDRSEDKCIYRCWRLDLRSAVVVDSETILDGSRACRLPYGEAA